MCTGTLLANNRRRPAASARPRHASSAAPVAPAPPSGLALPRDPPLIRYRVAKSVTCITAAACENLEVLRWARAHDCPWDSCTCAEGCCEWASEGAQMRAGAGLPVSCGTSEIFVRYDSTCVYRRRCNTRNITRNEQHTMIMFA